MLKFEQNNAVVTAWNKSDKIDVVGYKKSHPSYVESKYAYHKANEALREYKRIIARPAAYIAGAGFVGQQSCENRLSGEMKSKYLIVSGLFYKIGYAAFPGSLQPGTTYGDINTFAETGGKDVARVSIAISGVLDVYRGIFDPDSKWSVGFYRSTAGQPGLQFNYIF